MESMLRWKRPFVTPFCNERSIEVKFRRNKIKREHSIIDGALEWLEDLSRKPEVTDIIPGVIDVTNSRERGITYQYETPTGCKLMLKNGGSIQEAFVVTKKPQAVQEWVKRIMADLELFQASINDLDIVSGGEKGEVKPDVKTKSPKGAEKKGSAEKAPLQTRSELLAGIKEQVQMVEINQGMRDSLVESLATMADLDNPKLEDALEPAVRDALENLQEKLGPNLKTCRDKKIK